MTFATADSSGDAPLPETLMYHGRPLPRPLYGAEFEALLATFSESFPPTITPDMIEPLRAGGEEWTPTIDGLLEGRSIEREDRTAPGAEGRPAVVVSLFRSGPTSAGSPAVFFIHGGGFVFGDRFTGLGEALDWVERLGIVLVTVEYRLAPEHPDPAPVQDCYTGLRWLFDHASELGVDAERIVIAGSSAGGGLAAGVALLARDRSDPSLLGQVLIYPMLDERNDSVSARQFRGLGVWDQGSNDTGWSALLGDRRGTDAVTPYASPSRARRLAALPQAYIDVGSTETFRDEAVVYASRLWADGVQAELHVWPGVFHGFDGMLPDAALSIAAHRARQEWLVRVFAEGPRRSDR
jgi:acetyl esterase/lipase